MAKKLYVKNMPENFTKSIETSFLLKQITANKTADSGKEYYSLQLMDASGIIRGTIWKENMKKDHENLQGKIVCVKALVIQDAKENYQLVIYEMTEVETYVMADYINCLTEEKSSLYKEMLLKYIVSIENTDYKNLVSSVYSNIKDIELYPATIKGHHSFSGGYLVYVVSTTCLVNYMILSLSRYNMAPSYNIPYDKDLLITAALLHAVGTMDMLTPYPDMHRITESIPLSLHELTVRHIQNALNNSGKSDMSNERLNLLFHVIGCVYEGKKRKPVNREAVLLRQAVNIHNKISLLEHFMYHNQEKEGIIFDDMLGNYLYLAGKEKP